jgi:hypothetical protein
MKKLFLLIPILFIIGCAETFQVLDILCPSAKYSYGDSVCYQEVKAQVMDVRCNNKDSCLCDYTYRIRRQGTFEEITVREFELQSCQ